VERAEEYLHKEGFRQIRVRIHGRLARIEAEPVDFERIMKDEMREGIYTALKEIGFEFVSLDLFGYKTGSMN
ncbi:MAG: TIGR00268 family protein, partial [Firmicutes bacterium]|nr:TIGR00268 family protein [Bacillota bacterium]